MVCILFMNRKTKALQPKVLNCKNICFCDPEHIDSRGLIKPVEFISPVWMFGSELGHLGLSALLVEGSGVWSVRRAGL